MIEVKSLSKSRILVVGGGILVNKVVDGLTSQGVIDITVINDSVTLNRQECKFMQKDPGELIQKDSDFFKAYDLVLSADQPRPFEVALSNSRWPENASGHEPDLPMMVMRCVSNNCKMRCQYRELLVNGTKSSKFVSLPMELLPWTDEKRNLVASTIYDRFKPEHDPNIKAYFEAASAFVSFQQSKGLWPGAEDSAEVKDMVSNSDHDLQQKINDLVDQFCQYGLAIAPETTDIMSWLVVSDAVKLLTGHGQPINNTNLDEVIRIVADSQMD